MRVMDINMIRLMAQADEQHTTPYKGIQYHKVFRFNSWCHVLVIEAGAARYEVTKAGLKTVSQVQRETGANFVTNGGDYFGSGRSNGLHYVKGVQQSPQVDWQPFVNFTKDNAIQILESGKQYTSYNSLAGKRFIVLDGAISQRTSSAWYEKHPRTLYGVGARGQAVIAIIDGRQDNSITGHTEGVNLFDGARVLIEFGAVRGIDLDGGGSSTINQDGQTLNSPIDSGTIGKERAVGNHICIFLTGEVVDVELPPIETAGKKYIVVTAVRPRSAPSMFTISTAANLPVGTVFTGTESNGWVQMSDGRWVVMNWLGREYVKEHVVIAPGKAVYGQVLDKWMVDYNKNVFIADNLPMGVNSIPAVGQMAQLSTDKPVRITKQIAGWWYKLTQEVTPKDYPHDEIVKTLLNLTQGRKAFTNNTGWDEGGGNRIEHWSGEPQTGKREDMGLQYCFSSGSTYKIIGERRIAGKDCWVIEAMNALDPATLNITYKGNEHLFSVATSNSRSDRLNGYTVNPFPRLYNRTRENYSRVLVPLLANGRKELYIQKKYIRLLDAGETCPAYPYREP